MKDSAELPLEFAGEDRLATLVVPRQAPQLITYAATDGSADSALRDISIWTMLLTKPRNMLGTLREIGSIEPDERLRKSAAWALYKAGATDQLRSTLDAEASDNIGVWKLHLLKELQDDLTPSENRPFRQLTDTPFDFTMPLEIQGFVEYRDRAGNWRTVATGPVSNERMVGKLTPGVNAPTYQSEIVLQKRIENIRGTRTDYVEGYRLVGLSRQLTPHIVRHQYEGISRHPVFVSGRVGDESQGTIDHATASLMRSADTLMGVSTDIATPFPVSVRGSFRGFTYVDPDLAENLDEPLDGRLQIISPTDPEAGRLVNGTFYGTFRGVLEDVDGDGKVEVNGIEMLVDPAGNVTDRKPANRG